MGVEFGGARFFHGSEINGKFFRYQKNQGEDKKNRNDPNAHAISSLKGQYYPSLSQNYFTYPTSQKIKSSSKYNTYAVSKSNASHRFTRPAPLRLDQNIGQSAKDTIK